MHTTTAVTGKRPRRDARRQGRHSQKLASLTVLLSVVAVVVLALTDHSEAATAVGTTGGALAAFGGIQTTRSRQ